MIRFSSYILYIALLIIFVVGVYFCVVGIYFDWAIKFFVANPDLV